MTPQLNKKWNESRTRDRESGKEGPVILKETIDQNKVTLKQSRPR